MSEIVQLSTSNTFGQWVSSTQQLITKVNSLTDGGNAFVFYANTNLEIGNNVTIGGDLTVTGNIVLDSIGFDDLYVNGNVSIANTLSVTGNTTLSGLQVTGNIATINTTSDAFVGDDLFVYGDASITGNLTVSGNITLDSIGFDDLDVAGSGSFGNNLIVIGTSDFTGNATFGNANVTGTLTADIFVGTANTSIYNAIALNDGSALAYAIALG